MRLRIALAVTVLVPGIAVAQPTKLAGPDPEVKKLDTPVTLPAVPSFALAPGEPGFVDPFTLRVRGKQVLDTQVRVKGYVVWIYDCIEAENKPKESKKQTQKRIDADPTLCERPKFYLGTAARTSPESALWVVDVPRPPNFLEKTRLPKEDLAARPPVPPLVSKLKVGDFVVVTGDFKLSSPHSERNSDGLIVFSAIEAAKPAASASTAPTAGPQPPALPPRKAAAIPPAKPVDPKARASSMKLLNDGNREMGLKHFADGIDRYQRAINAWDGNHLAWYGLGASHAQTSDWKNALAAFESAVKLGPGESMYQMWAGIAAYEAAVQQARIDQAAKQNLKPDDIRADLSAVDFTASRAYLEAAVAVEPRLWRAHYYIGRIFREGGYEQRAAEGFAQAIKLVRNQPGPYIALGELYRKWDYTKEAIEVATLGTQEVTSPIDASDIHYVLGMAYDDQRDHKRAIEAFTRALDAKADNAKARFQRGQAYFKLNKHKEAKADLEAFVDDAPPSLAFAKQQAEKMLMDIAAKKKK